jgi:hypothetical protein
VLVAGAAESVSRFLGARENNLKYAGIDALTRLVLIDPKHAQVCALARRWRCVCTALMCGGVCPCSVVADIAAHHWMWAAARLGCLCRTTSWLWWTACGPRM